MAPTMKFSVPGSWNVSLAVWANKKSYSFSFQNRKKDKETGSYQETPWYYYSDLLALRACIDAAIQYTLTNPINEGISSSATDNKESSKIDDDDINF